LLTPYSPRELPRLGRKKAGFIAPTAETFALSEAREWGGVLDKDEAKG
jgi:hypothetical protein